MTIWMFKGLDMSDTVPDLLPNREVARMLSRLSFQPLVDQRRRTGLLVERDWTIT